MDNNIFKFIQQQQHNISSTDDIDYAMTQRRQPTTTTTTMHQRQQLMQYACGTILTCLNDKAFQGMSPQQFGWLKHPRA